METEDLAEIGRTRGSQTRSPKLWWRSTTWLLIHIATKISKTSHTTQAFRQIKWTLQAERKFYCLHFVFVLRQDLSISAKLILKLLSSRFGLPSGWDCRPTLPNPALTCFLQDYYFCLFFQKGFFVFSWLS